MRITWDSITACIQESPCNRACNRVSKCNTACNRVFKCNRACNRVSKCNRACNRVFKSNRACNRVFKCNRACNRVSNCNRVCNRACNRACYRVSNRACTRVCKAAEASKEGGRAITTLGSVLGLSRGLTAPITLKTYSTQTSKQGFFSNICFSCSQWTNCTYKGRHPQKKLF